MLARDRNLLTLRVRPGKKTCTCSCHEQLIPKLNDHYQPEQEYLQHMDDAVNVKASMHVLSE